MNNFLQMSLQISKLILNDFFSVRDFYPDKKLYSKSYIFGTLKREENPTNVGRVTLTALGVEKR